MVKGISETEKTKEGRFLPSLIPVLINNITRKEISETEKKTRRWNYSLFYTSIDKNYNSIVPLHHLSNIKITMYFNFKTRLNSIFQETVYLE